MFETKPEVSKTQTISNQKIALNDSFAHNLTYYHAQIVIFF